MVDPLKYPRLRQPVEVRLEKIQGQEVLVLRCPLGVSPIPLVLVPAVAPVIANFDGKTSVEEISERLSQYGATLDLVQKLVGIIDENCFLESPRFYEAARRLNEEFTNSNLRAATLAGHGYATEAAALAAELSGYFSLTGDGIPQNGKLLALIAPHIDYRRGHLCYARTYKQLLSEPDTLCIVLGTSHQYSRNLFHLTRKNFACPLGDFQCDREFVDRLAAGYGEKRSFADEILHRREHAIELQLPFLRHTLNPSRMVGILVGSCAAMYQAGADPALYEPYESFVQVMVQLVQERQQAGERVLFIAGVDMAHLGRAFGDKGALDAGILAQAETRDRQYMNLIAAGDPALLAAHIAEDGDQRRVCGFPTIYTLLDVLKRLGLRCRTEVFDYSQAVDYPNDCAVTCAGIGMYTS